MTPQRILTQLGAAGVAATGFWLGLFATVAPPDPDSALFFAGWCALIGVLAGGVLLFLHHIKKDDARVLFGLAIVAVVVGIAGLVGYEHYRVERTVVVAGDSSPGPRIVTDRLSTLGYGAASKTYCSEELVDPTLRRVSWACARTIANQLSAEDARLFNPTARDQSRTTLVTWYRAAAFGWIVFLILTIDYALEQVKRRRRPHPPHAQAPAAPGGGTP